MLKTLEKPVDKEFLFDEKNHVYTLEGKRLYGTTTVLGVIAKPALINWAANMTADVTQGALLDWVKENVDGEVKVDASKLVDFLLFVIKEARTAHNKKKETAGELGTDIHTQLEKLIKVAIELGGKMEPYMVAEDTPKQVKEFVQWAILKNVHFLATEKRLYSESLWCAGTADFICLIDGKLYIGDIKTSSAIYPEHMIQASAYAHMAMEMGLYDEFHGVIIVNIPKRGGLKVKENYNVAGNFEVFKSALTIFKFQQSQKINK